MGRYMGARVEMGHHQLLCKTFLKCIAPSYTVKDQKNDFWERCWPFIEGYFVSYHVQLLVMMHCLQFQPLKCFSRV